MYVFLCLRPSGRVVSMERDYSDLGDSIFYNHLFGKTGGDGSNRTLSLCGRVILPGRGERAAMKRELKEETKIPLRDLFFPKQKDGTRASTPVAPSSRIHPRWTRTPRVPIQKAGAPAVFLAAEYSHFWRDLPPTETMLAYANGHHPLEVVFLSPTGFSPICRTPLFPQIPP